MPDHLPYAPGVITISEADGVEPRVPGRVLVVSAHPSADRFVDIPDTFDAKVGALRAHASQTSAMDLDPFLRAWARTNATVARLGEDRLAEAFLTCRTG